MMDEILSAQLYKKGTVTRINKYIQAEKYVKKKIFFRLKQNWQKNCRGDNIHSLLEICNNDDQF